MIGAQLDDWGAPGPDTIGEREESCLEVRNRLTSVQKHPERDAGNRNIIKKAAVPGYYKKFGLG